MGVSRKVLCIDGNNILVRGIKATEGRVELSADGVSTAPLLIFINCLSRYVREEEPDRLVVCWDGGRSGYRSVIFPSYKASRHTVEMDEGRNEMRNHFTLAQEFLSLAGLHHVQVAHAEADDLVAHYWRVRDKDHRFVILSGDKDFLQLLDGWTEQIRPGSGPGYIDRWTTNRVRTEMKCKPEHLPMVMALTGDAIDGIPGVPGFGHKTACKLLGKYDWDLDALLAANEAKLIGAEADVRRNLLLVSLREAAPDPFALEGPPAPRFEPTTPGSPLWGALLDWLDRYEMRTVKDRLMAGTLWEGKEPPRSGRPLKLPEGQRTLI